MEEEDKKNEDKGEEQGSEDSGEGDKSETDDVIKRQSEKIKELEKERYDRQIADAKKQLGGDSEAGKEPEKPKEETPKEYVDREFGHLK